MIGAIDMQEIDRFADIFWWPLLACVGHSQEAQFCCRLKNARKLLGRMPYFRQVESDTGNPI